MCYLIDFVDMAHAVHNSLRINSFMMFTKRGVKNFFAVLRIVAVSFWGGGWYLFNSVVAHI